MRPGWYLHHRGANKHLSPTAQQFHLQRLMVIARAADSSCGGAVAGILSDHGGRQGHRECRTIVVLELQIGGGRLIVGGSHRVADILVQLKGFVIHGLDDAGSRTHALGKGQRRYLTKACEVTAGDVERQFVGQLATTGDHQFKRFSLGDAGWHQFHLQCVAVIIRAQDMQGLALIAMGIGHADVGLPGSDDIIVHGIEPERHGCRSLGNHHFGRQHIVVAQSCAEQLFY